MYPLPTWARRTLESESGYWPTPTASDGTAGNVQKEIYFLRSGKPRGLSNNGVDGSIGLARMVKMIWPTPTSRDWKDGTAQSCANVPENGLLGRAVHTRFRGLGNAVVPQIPEIFARKIAALLEVQA